MSRDTASENALLARPRLPYPVQLEKSGYDIDRAKWRTLIDVIFPTAETSESVALALAYCKARGLDILKKPVNIVPVWNKSAGRTIETVWPSIAESRTTATRTGGFAGFDAVHFGPIVKKKFSGREKVKKEWQEVTLEVEFPEWACITVYRLVGGIRAAFPGPRTYWLETYGHSGGGELPNAMWRKRPFGQLEKCAEAAALRRAFPEEIGSHATAEEMEGQTVEYVTPEHRKHFEATANSEGVRSEIAGILRPPPADKGQWSSSAPPPPPPPAEEIQGAEIAEDEKGCFFESADAAINALELAIDPVTDEMDVRHLEEVYLSLSVLQHPAEKGRAEEIFETKREELAKNDGKAS